MYQNKIRNSSGSVQVIHTHKAENCSVQLTKALPTALFPFLSLFTELHVTTPLEIHTAMPAGPRFVAGRRDASNADRCGRSEDSEENIILVTLSPGRIQRLLAEG